MGETLKREVAGKERERERSPHRIGRNKRCVYTLQQVRKRDLYLKVWIERGGEQ